MVNTKFCVPSIHTNVLIMLESGILFNDSLFYLRFKTIKYNVGKVWHGIGSDTSVSLCRL